MEVCLNVKANMDFTISVQFAEEPSKLEVNRDIIQKNIRLELIIKARLN